MKLTKAFLLALCASAISVPAWSANIRYEGVPVTERVERSGKSVGDNEHISRRLTTQVNRISSQQVWRSEQIPSPQCSSNSGSGSGHGSGDWKGYWDASDSRDKARRLALAIAGLGDEGAEQIVRDGYLRTIPRDWNEFQKEIRRADNQPDSLGYASRVLGPYAEQNKKNLGYAMDHQTGTGGDGDWQGYWDASSWDRPARLQRAVRGLTSESARAVVQSGYLDRLPRDWRAFADAISNADRRAQTGFSYEVLVRNGRENMQSLGYYDSSSCTMSSISERVLRTEEVREFDHTAQRQIEVDIENAPLLKGETETLTMTFDGLNEQVAVNSSYYRYSQRRELDSSGAATYHFVGSRQQVEPVNTVNIVLTKQNGHVALDLSDSAWEGDLTNPLGDVVVNVEIWQSRFLFDKKLGTMQVKLPSVGQPYHVETQVVPSSGAKVYAYYSIQRTGSRYYTSQASKQLSSEKMQF